MVKLSEQLVSTKVQTRPTRTQRVAQQQAEEREYKTELKKFNELKTEAQELQKTEFSNIKSIEEYEQKYNKLSPQLQQFFSTPTQLRQEKTERIETNISKISEKRSNAQKEIQDARSKYETKLKEAREYYDRQRARYPDKAGYYREQYDKRSDDLEEDYETKVAKLEGYQQGLDEGLAQLREGKDVNISDIESYARDVASYEEQKERAKIENRTAQKEQLRKIESLEEQGYTPQVVQTSYKGMPSKVSLQYYNKATGDWQRIADYSTKGSVDVSNLERVGTSAPIERTLSVAGKDYKFTTSTSVYKAPSGELVTAYERSGLTQEQLALQQQDAIYEEWKKTQPDQPVEVIAKKEGQNIFDKGWNFVGDVVSRSPLTVSLFPFPRPVIRTDKSKKELASQIKLLEDGSERVMEGYEYIPKGEIYFTPKPFPSLTAGLSVDVGLRKPEGISLSSIKSSIVENIEKKAVIEQDKQLEQIGVKDIEAESQKEYQQVFEQKYMKDIIYGTKTFEEASKEFAESEEAKTIQKNYEITVENELADLGITKGGFKMFGWSALKGGVSLVPTTVKSTAVTGALVYGGYKGLQLIPKSVGYAVSGGFLAEGVYTGFLSPTASPEERAGGVIRAGISAGVLGYGAYKYLRQPVVKTVKIKAPRRTLKSSEVIGIDINDKLVLFGKQKLSQVGISGRRTIVTTKWRSLLNKYLKTDIQPIYQGVPTEQLGRVYQVEGVRSTSLFTAQKSGYQKALDLLKKYGVPETTARATLRYTAPRYIEKYLQEGYLVVGKGKASGEFTYLTKQPSIVVDEKLGIKTRGARTIKDIYDIERNLITLNKKTYVLEESTRTSFYFKGNVLDAYKSSGYSASIVKAKASDIGTLSLPVSEKEFQDIYGISFSESIIPSSKKLGLSASKTKLIKETINFDREFTQGVRYTGGKKTPFWKSFIEEPTKKVVKITPPPTTPPKVDIQRIVNKIEKTSSKFYGTGQYERTADFQTTFKAPFVPSQTFTQPSLSVQNIKDIIQAGEIGAIKVGSLGALGLSQKSVSGLKTELKAEFDLKSISASDTKLISKQVQVQQLKSAGVLKSQLRSLLKTEQVSVTTTIPKIYSINTPRIVEPQFNIPLPIPFYLGGRSTRKKKKGKKRGIYEQAYLPDFTARALGLGAEKLSEKQAMARVKKILTGLEIRRGIKLR